MDTLSRSRRSSVNIVTRLRAGWLGLDSRQGSPSRPDQSCGPPSLLSSGHRCYFPGAWSAPLTSISCRG